MLILGGMLGSMPGPGGNGEGLELCYSWEGGALLLLLLICIGHQARVDKLQHDVVVLWYPR